MSARSFAAGARGSNARYPSPVTSPTAGLTADGTYAEPYLSWEAAAGCGDNARAARAVIVLELLAEAE